MSDSLPPVPPFSDIQRNQEGPFFYGDPKLAMKDFVTNFFMQPSIQNQGVMDGKIAFMGIFAKLVGGSTETDFKQNVLPAFKAYSENPDSATEQTLSSTLMNFADSVPHKVPNFNQILSDTMLLMVADIKKGGGNDALLGLAYSLYGVMFSSNQFPDEMNHLAQSIFKEARDLVIGVGNPETLTDKMLSNIQALLSMMPSN